MSGEIKLALPSNHHDSRVPIQPGHSSQNNINETRTSQKTLFTCIRAILVSCVPYIGTFCLGHEGKDTTELEIAPNLKKGQHDGDVPTTQSAGSVESDNLLGMIPDNVEEGKRQRKVHVREPARMLVYLFIILVFSFSIPKLRDNAFLDLAPLWQWVLFGILIVAGNSLSYLFGNWVVSFLAWSHQRSKGARYYFEGLEHAIHFTLFTVLFLLTNVIYFANTDVNTHINKGAQYKGSPLYIIVTRYVIATSLSGMVASFLWLVKTFLLLQLKAAQVYRRLEHKIDMMTKPVWFLAIISEQYTDKELQYLKKILGPSNGWLHKIYRKAKYFMNISNMSLRSRDEEIITKEFLDKCDKKIKLRDGESIGSNHLECLSLSPDEATTLLSMVPKRSPPEPSTSMSSPSLVTYGCFKTWLIETYKECLKLGHTLCDCRAAVHQLGRVFTAVIIYLVGVYWLIMTGNGSTKVLLAIAYPLTTGAFMFQEAGKNLFEGIVFTFLKHPFDVGDLCIIDGDQLEVKRLGIAMTVFFKDESKAEVQIPNSILASKSIINLKSTPHAFDYLELNLDPETTYAKIEQLKNKIESDTPRMDIMIQPDHHGSVNETTHPHGTYKNEGTRMEVIVKEVEATIKLFVFFKHDDVTADNDMEYSKFLRSKNKRRSRLLLQVKQLLDEFGIKHVAPPPKNV